MMKKLLGFAVVLVCVLSLTQADHRCNNPDDHLKRCSKTGICAWNKCKCSPGDRGCRLICTNRKDKWCNGLSENDSCAPNTADFKCKKGHGNKLACSGLGRSNPFSGSSKSSGVCLTQGCVLAAARIVSAMDMTVNPCDDFYNFACGRWLSENVVPEDDTSISVNKLNTEKNLAILKAILEENESGDIEVETKAKTFYQTCVDEDKIEELGLTTMQNYMTELGGWPVLGTNPGGNWNEANYNFEDLLIAAGETAQSTPFFDVLVAVDPQNPPQRIISIFPPGFGTGQVSWYLGGNEDKLMAYQTYLEDLAVAFGADQATAATFAEDIVDMETQLANIVPPPRTYNLGLAIKSTLGELNAAYTGVDLEKLIRGELAYGGFTLDDTEPILVGYEPYMTNVGAIIAGFTPSQIQNYVVIRAILADNKRAYLPKAIRDVHQKYMEALYGVSTETPRWEYCIYELAYVMPEVIGRLYVRERFEEKAKLDVDTLISRLQKSFLDVIDKLSWMEATTKEVAKEKIRKLSTKIGYPEIDDDAMNALYDELVVNDADFTATGLNTYQFRVRSNLKELREDEDPNDWILSAIYDFILIDFLRNQLNIPAAFLQPPVYSIDQPRYLNYGAGMYRIAYLLVIGIDGYLGRFYGPDGKSGDWWTTEDETKFTERVQCVIDQYNAFINPITGENIDGNRLKQTNVGREGGLQISFKAYRDWVTEDRNCVEEDKLPGLDYTPNQLYFLNNAQAQCTKYRDTTAKFRVVGPLQNFDEFAKAWNCPVGSYMNPANKCDVW